MTSKQAYEERTKTALDLLKQAIDALEEYKEKPTWGDAGDISRVIDNAREALNALGVSN